MAAAAAVIAGRTSLAATRSAMFTVYTFGDSILDCARYNNYDVHPGQLRVRNDDALFPPFKRRDLASLGPARLAHGALVDVRGHFLRGDPSWFTRTIESSLRGASEVRAAFLPQVLQPHAA